MSKDVFHTQGVACQKCFEETEIIEIAFSSSGKLRIACACQKCKELIFAIVSWDEVIANSAYMDRKLKGTLGECNNFVN